MSKNFLKMNEIFLIIIILGVMVVPFSFFLDYVCLIKSVMVLTLGTAVLVTIALVKVLKKGFKPARFYAIAWSFFWLGVVFYSLRTFSILPDNIVTRWGMQTASLMEVVLISLGLADRINILKNDLESLNLNLENIVEDRTIEVNSILNKMEKRDSEIQMELELAADIQSGILPQTPCYYEGVKVDSFYRSMGKVGGDFFDIFQMQGGHLGILIADASGHGMPAAFITALAKISFSETMQSQLFPRDIFTHVNNDLLKTIKTDDFITAFFVVISPSFEVFYGNASHHKTLVLRRGDLTIDEWDTNGLFLGAMEQANEMFEDGQDSLDYGDRLLLFTDGITEAKNREGEIFGTNRLKKLFVETANMTIEEAKDDIVCQWGEFTRGTSQTDDVTLVIVEVDPVYREVVLYREKGFKLLAEKNYAEAISELNKALKIDRNDEKTHLYIGECYLYGKNYMDAVKHLREYLSKVEIDANVWCHLAEAYYNLRNYSEAFQTAQKALQYRNNFVKALEITGLSLMALQKKKGAYKIWKKILSSESKNEIALREIQKIKDEVDKNK